MVNNQYQGEKELKSRDPTPMKIKASHDYKEKMLE